MGKIQAMHKCFALFLALLACNDSLLTYGRKIKPLNQHSPLNTDAIALADNPHPSLPVHGTGVHVPTTTTEKKVESSSTTQNYDVEASFEDSGAPNTNAFRPTTPGGSPGVGHPKFSGQDKDVKAVLAVQSPDVKVSVTGVSTNDFRPTDPGNSPGVGHAQHN